MTKSQLYSVAILGLLLSSSYSLTVPVPFSSSVGSPAAGAAGGGLSSTEAYLDSLTNIGDAWSAASFEQSIQGVIDDAAHAYSSSSLEQPVIFGMHSTGSSFDFDLAD